MEGTTVKVPNKPGMNPEKIEINTKNILFMVGGAFVGLDSVVLQRVGKNKIGFDSASKLDEDLWVDFLETQDLVSYGLIPEFVGRVPSVNVLKDLRREELLQVLTEPENSIIKQYQALFELDKIQLEFNIKALEEIVDIAMKQDLGARGLRKILDDALLEIQYSLPDYRSQNVERMVITHDTIKDGKKPLLIKGNNT
jgi:ATP-dependent Clp protease ATP-binding subunit ClpX